MLDRARGWGGALAAACALLIVAGSLVANASGRGARGLDAEGLVLVLLAASSPLLGLRRPVWALAAASTATAVFFAAGYASTSPVYLSMLAALLQVGAARRPWRSAGAAVFASAVVVAEHLATAGAGGLTPAILATSGWIAAASAAGYAWATHRAYLQSLQDRARWAEESKERAAQQRVAEERLRIARELHDIVSHTISVINVQAGVATHVIDRRPEQAAIALATIRDTSREALHELGEILAVLRDPDGRDPRSPAPGLAELESLLRTTREAGLRVGMSVMGERRPLAPSLELAAYRIVQEALTNALRYGAGGCADVRLRYGTDRLTVEVDSSSPAPARAPRGAGMGLVGMRERAAALGGTCEAGPRADGGFRVSACLPMRA